MSIQISSTLSIPVDANFRKVLREIPVGNRWKITGNFIKVATNANIKKLSPIEKTAFAIIYAATWRVIVAKPNSVFLRYFTVPSGADQIDRLNENEDVFLVCNTSKPYLQGYAYTEQHEEPVMITLEQIAQGIDAFSIDDSKMVEPIQFTHNTVPPIYDLSKMGKQPFPPSSTFFDIKKSHNMNDEYDRKIAEKEFQQRVVQYLPPRLPDRFSYPEPVVPPQPPKFASDPNHPYPTYAYARKL